MTRGCLPDDDVGIIRFNAAYGCVPVSSFTKYCAHTVDSAAQALPDAHKSKAAYKGDCFSFYFNEFAGSNCKSNYYCFYYSMIYDTKVCLHK